MMQVIDEDYIAGIAALPDGNRRLLNLFTGALERADTAEAIAKACVAQSRANKHQTIDNLKPEVMESFRLLEWFDKRHDLDLSWDAIDDDLSECAWRVHQSHGGHNDREWKLICHDETAIGALRKAHKAFCDGR